MKLISKLNSKNKAFYVSILTIVRNVLSERNTGEMKNETNT
tara:strand:+ start:479 stop:601 length:123 start_codon:yes stop_codon:yes gene_type:complete